MLLPSFKRVWWINVNNGMSGKGEGIVIPRWAYYVKRCEAEIEPLRQSLSFQMRIDSAVRKSVAVSTWKSVIENGWSFWWVFSNCWEGWISYPFTRSCGFSLVFTYSVSCRILKQVIVVVSAYIYMHTHTHTDVYWGLWMDSLVSSRTLFFSSGFFAICNFIL